MLEAHTFFFDAEEIRVERNKGKYSIAGYSLENEKLALTLTGVTGEVGRLLLALQEHNDQITPLNLLLEGFMQDLQSSTSSLPRYRALDYSSHLIEIYLSYSPDPTMRVIMCRNADLPNLAWKRLMTDPASAVADMAMRRAKGPQEEFTKFVKSDNAKVRTIIAVNENLSQNHLLALANDPNGGVRERVANRRDLPRSLRPIIMARTQMDRAWWERKMADDELKKAKAALKKALLGAKAAMKNELRT